MEKIRFSASRATSDENVRSLPEVARDISPGVRRSDGECHRRMLVFVVHGITASRPSLALRYQDHG